MLSCVGMCILCNLYLKYSALPDQELKFNKTYRPTMEYEMGDGGSNEL